MKCFQKTLLYVVALIMCIMSVRIDVFATEADNTLFSPTLMYTVDKVNVRSGPGTDYDIIGELESGTSIFAKSLEEGWYKVIYANTEGYIRQDFLAFYGEAAPALTVEMQQSSEVALEESVVYEQERVAIEEQIAEEIAAAEEAERLQAQAEEEEAKRLAEEEALAKAKGKRNNIIIIVGIVVLIIGYSVLQIIKGKDEDDEEDIDEYDEYDYCDEDTFEEISEDEVLDLDEAFTPEELERLNEAYSELDDDQVEFIDLYEIDEIDEFKE